MFWRRANRPNRTLSWPEYASYEEAAKHNRGYDDEELTQVILEKALAFRRSPPSLTWSQGGALVTGPLYAAIQCKHRPLRVLDVGGSFGNHAWICQQTLPFAQMWAIVENPKIVAASGPAKTDTLQVFSSIPEAIQWLGGEVDLVYSSGAIQCVPEPLALAGEMATLRAPVIYLQRLFFAHRTIITVQEALLSSNGGPGGLPQGYVDRTLSFPITYSTEADLLSAFKDYKVVHRVPCDEAMPDGLGRFGGALLLSLSPVTSPL